MSIKTALGLTVLLALPSELQAETPLSAIDWLSDSVTSPVVAPEESLDKEIAINALPEEVTVTALGRPVPDAVGLLPIDVTGLPRDLWGSSTSVDLARRFEADRIDLLPAMQELLYTLLLAELDPPQDADQENALFLSRVDTLLALGALDPALALLERAGTNTPQSFRRYFDVSLLLGSEDKACATLRNTPDLSPTFPARIFCLARGGEWDTAALTLDTAEALGFVSEDEGHLLARFLDPQLFEDEPPLERPKRPNPLVFRMMEAIGEAMPTDNLALAFANADLGSNSGWRAQISAAERLARTGAIDPNKLLGFYTARLPAASGGIWDRVDAIQRFDVAMRTRDPGGVANALPKAWDAVRVAELEIQFARLYGEKLTHLPLPDDARKIAFHVGLLSDAYETVANNHSAQSPEDKLLTGIATGRVSSIPPDDALAAAIRDGFSGNAIPVRLRSLTDTDRLGEAMLRSIELFSTGSHGDYDELSDALAFFRAVGLEDTARKAALQLVLLERRG